MHSSCILYFQYTYISIFLLLIASAVQCNLANADKSLHVGLHAAWRNTRTSAEAATWIAQTISPKAIQPLLSNFCAALPNFLNRDHLTPLSQNDEQRLVLQSAKPLLNHDPAALSTLRWILNSRHFSPHISMHYSVAGGILSHFHLETHQHPSVFAILTDLHLSNAKLLTEPSHVNACENCPSIESHHPFSFLQPMQPEIILSSQTQSNHILIIFADIATIQFCDWLPFIRSLLQSRSQRVILRFWSPKAPGYNPGLQSFTVQATLKSTEYKVVDDHTFSARLFSDCGYTDAGCGVAINASTAWTDTSKPTSFTGLQSLQYITQENSNDIDTVLAKISSFVEDGPSITRSDSFLSKTYINSTLGKQFSRSVQRIRDVIGEQQLLFINGHSFSPSLLKEGSDNLFRCLSSLSTASAMLGKLFKPETSPADVFTSTQSLSESSQDRLRVDLRLEELVPNSLVRLNNLQSDKRYKKWKSLDVHSETDIDNFVTHVTKRSEESASSHEGSNLLVKVRADHLSLVLVVDPGDMKHFPYLSVPESIIRADLPLQVSLLLVPNGEVSSLITAGFHYLVKMKGRKTAVSFLSVIQQFVDYFRMFQQAGLSPQIVEMAFGKMISEEMPAPKSLADVISNDEDVKLRLQEAEIFAKNINLFAKAEDDDDEEREGIESKERKMSMLCVLNGAVVKDVAEDIVPLALSEELRIAKLLADKESITALSQSERAFNKWIASDSSLIVVRKLGRNMKTLNRATAVSTKEDILPPLTANALFSMKASLDDVDYIFPNSVEGSTATHTTTVWLAGLSRSTPEFQRMKNIIDEVAQSDVSKRTQSRFAILDPSSDLCEEVLGCSSNMSCLHEPVLVINGRRLPSSLFQTVDDVVVEVASVFKDVSEMNLLDDECRLLYRLHVDEISATCEYPNGKRDTGPSFSQVRDAIVEHGHDRLVFPNGLFKNPAPLSPISITAIVDPSNPEAYVMASFLRELRLLYSSKAVALALIIAPSTTSLARSYDQPKIFYRFVLQSSALFQDESGNRLPPRASFFSLPQGKVLTIATETPRAWFVSSYATNHDMDNIILETLPENITELHAEYELRNLIVEGSCAAEGGSPPQGLKLYLENDSGVSVNTLVMANLGYFQLKVPTPGRWNLRLAPGRSRKIFSLKSMEMYKGFTKTMYAADSSGGVAIPVESLDGAGGILLRVTRNPGMDGKPLLGVDVNSETLSTGRRVFQRMGHKLLDVYKNLKKGDSDQIAKGVSSENKQKTIHVFSVASGHLYERFLKIMITSATKHASRPIKFWLLENYLSPSFKKVLPLFAKRHGAQVEMITYRWPGWLRAQKEKQRIIWAYKILFLDVLFPLDVERIIFVDSDQVLRGDLAELMDIDLKGAPYGYVPFCDSRKEVEGFRFWKTGFWKETLQGAKYRISALYVVDLNRFRETSAGDTLRYVYLALSSDPNSLSNLDQDLPNYASTMSSVAGIVPIFNLPQDWLWCESWCDDESKKSAKAIDLCNNPMTKEPKLSSARRIIPEWVGYDNSASKLTEELYGLLLSRPSHTIVDERNVLESSACKENCKNTHKASDENSSKEDL